jgi:hypothetical protein
MSVYSNYAEFTNPGTYTVSVPSKVNSIKVYLVGAGGGGGGGGGSHHTNRGHPDAGGGGGAGGSPGIIQSFTNNAATVSGDITITVGKAGTGGTVGRSVVSGRSNKNLQANTKADPGKAGTKGEDSIVKIKSETFTSEGGSGGAPGNGGQYQNRNSGMGGENPKANNGKKGSYANKRANGGVGGPATIPASITSSPGIYPNIIEPGKGGKGGNGANTDGSGASQYVGGNGNNGYARIYFINS